MEKKAKSKENISKVMMFRDEYDKKCIMMMMMMMMKAITTSTLSTTTTIVKKMIMSKHTERMDGCK